MRRAVRRVERLAPAKVNLSLEVLGRRDDGYHELLTVFQAVGLYDQLTFEAHEELTLEVNGDAPAGEDNLALIAARALAPYALGRGTRITLEKQIPTAAGLGGGSSDAAATLSGLNELWELGLPPSELERVGRELGADVPFFLYGGTALGSGRGDELEPIHRESRRDGNPWLVLSNPPFALRGKTARIFSRLSPHDFTDGARTRALARALRTSGSIEPELLYNGLQSTANREFKELQGYVGELRARSGLPWLLSGAGPACYCLTTSRHHAELIADSVGSLPGQRYVVAAL